jgi:hypothetical protein
MKTQNISLALYATDIELLDTLVERRKTMAINPAKINRSTVIRELIEKEQISYNSRMKE